MTSNKLITAFWLSSLLLFLIALQFISTNQCCDVSNLLIPDGITYLETVRGFQRGLVGLDDILAGWAVVIVYEGSYFFGLPGILLLNLFFFWIVHKLIGHYSFSIALILLPYFSLAMILPSKDIMAAAITASVFYFAREKRFFLALLTVIAGYFVRDGAFFMLLPFVAFALICHNRTLSYAYVVCIFIAALSSSYLLSTGGADLIIFQRNNAIYENVAADKFFGIDGSIEFFIRLFANATNWAFRPQFFDTLGDISMSGVAFYICGLSMIVSLFFSIKMFFSESRTLKLAGGLYLLSLITISINPLIQPRYQLPAALVVLTLAMPTFGRSYFFKKYAIAVGISLTATIAYSISGIPSPPRFEILRFDLLEYFI